MQLGLRAKLTMVMTALVLLTTLALAMFFLQQNLQRSLQDSDTRAKELALQIFDWASHADDDARAMGMRPASDDPQEIHDYVRKVFETSDVLNAQLTTATADLASIYEASIVDETGVVLVSSDPSQVGRIVPRRPPLSRLVQSSIVKQIKILIGPPQVYEVEYPFNVRKQPFGEVRVAVQTGLFLKTIEDQLRQWVTIAFVALVASTLLAAVVSGAALAPIRAISDQLDRISAGEYDTAPLTTERAVESTDELGQVRRKIKQVGLQLRGVHEIFSSLRENMNSVMAGLEDGLILFTRDARAVMVSPAAEKLLGAPASNFLGRRVTQMFPAGHPLHDALRLEGEEQLREIASETDLTTEEGTRRIGVTVQEIQGAGERMGALLTLRDLDSFESINTQLQVSERLSALGRITAGVAHEVKNPLNSMRLWLENLKESLPQGTEDAAKQAVNVLDAEIDRLDAVVKRFLDFSRPMDVRLEPTQLAGLLQEVLEVAAPQLERSKVQVAQLLPIDVPEVIGDRALLKQAILNLVLNAVDAMPNGGQLQLTLSRRGEMAEITVGDTGKGIPAEHRQKVFQLFFTTRPGGSGIGLASTFRIVQLHNGSIDFTSEVGRGTTFRIELPLAA
jgi:PAS domain S-box-containing protein